MFLCLFKHGPQVSQLREATLNIAMELKHETKVADIIIQFVLSLGTVRKSAPHHRQKLAV